MQTTEQSTAPVEERYRWTRGQYEQMIEAGVFDEDARVELIDGVVVTMSPQGSRHSTLVYLAQQALQKAYAPEFMIRSQLPLVLGAASEPEPDLAVVRGKPRDFLDEHPDTALLVVEVAEASLRMDRTVKAQLYARHAIPEYWILNVTEECLEIYRDPTGGIYGTKQTLRRGASVTPPGTEVALEIAELLP